MPKAGAPTAEQATNFDMLSPMLNSLHQELTELSKKKQEAVLNPLKIRHVNRILEQVKDCLGDDRSVDYLEMLDTDDVPQNSDAVVIVGQWRAAMRQFHDKHTDVVHGKFVWLASDGEVPAATGIRKTF